MDGPRAALEDPGVCADVESGVLWFPEESFAFYSASSGWKPVLQRYYQSICADDSLRSMTTLLPPLPPWRIPEFLRILDVSFCLENRFPIAFHFPIIPREILASGSCLVCSREIYEKLPFRVSPRIVRKYTLSTEKYKKFTSPGLY